ncbi:hypothetical protein LBMAG42_41830 [Deltaproteobacteria bacterium]|nr:hypothetical protein LBMAG42_41830 [Deltaproteobacteria bacterium]
MLTWMLTACIQPESGRYEITLEDTASDCPEGEVPTADAVWKHRLMFDDDSSLQNDDGRLHVFAGGDGTCPRAEPGEFSVCELSWLDTEADYASGGVDAVVSVDVDLRVTWTAAREITGQTIQSVSCAGPDCAAAESVSPPLCATTWTWTGRMP